MAFFSDHRLENLTFADLNAEISEDDAKEIAAAYAKTLTVPAAQMGSSVDAELTGMNTENCVPVLCDTEHPYLAYRIWDSSAPYRFADGTAARKTTKIDLTVYVDAHTGAVKDSVTDVLDVYNEGQNAEQSMIIFVRNGMQRGGKALYPHAPKAAVKQ